MRESANPRPWISTSLVPPVTPPFTHRFQDSTGVSLPVQALLRSAATVDDVVSALLDCEPRAGGPALEPPAPAPRPASAPIPIALGASPPLCSSPRSLGSSPPSGPPLSRHSPSFVGSIPMATPRTHSSLEQMAVRRHSVSSDMLGADLSAPYPSPCLTPQDSIFHGAVHAALALAPSPPDEPPPVQHAAVLGMGCRFPATAEGLEGFWRQLEQGLDCTSPIPLERWDNEAVYSEKPATPGKLYTRSRRIIVGTPYQSPACNESHGRHAPGVGLGAPSLSGYSLDHWTTSRGSRHSVQSLHRYSTPLLCTVTVYRYSIALLYWYRAIAYGNSVE